MKKTLLFAFLVILLGTAQASTIYLVDGRSIDAEIISETKDEVVYRISRGTNSVTGTIKRSEIREIVHAPKSVTRPTSTQPSELPTTRPADNRPRFYVIPIVGEIGRHVSADAVAQALKVARVQKVEVIVLYFDTPGGSVAEKQRIVDVIRQNTDLRLVALVRQAISAGAIIAMACPTIVMLPDGAIGAAVVYTTNKEGVPANVGAKFESAARAYDEGVANAAGHDPLLARGMISMDTELWLIRENTKTTLSTEHQPGAKQIKKEGEILTLGEALAAEVGLSAGTVDNAEELGRILGFQGWRQLGSADKIFEKEQLKTARREYAHQRLAEIDRLVADLSERWSSAQAVSTELRQQANAEAQAAEAEFTAEHRRATLESNEYAARAAERRRDAQISSIRASYGPRIAQADAAAGTIQRQVRALLAERAALIRQTPRR